MNVHSDALPKSSDSATTAATTPVHVDKRQRILAAALTLFAERGYHGTAVPEIAATAAVGAGTIYRHFADKQALVNAAFQQAKSQLRTLLQEHLDLQAPPRQLFSHLWQRLALFARRHPVEFRFLELHHHQSYLDADSLALESQVLAPIWLACEQLRQAGIARDLPAEVLMALIWGAFVGLFKAECCGYLRLDEARIAQAEEACWATFSRPGVTS